MAIENRKCMILYTTAVCNLNCVYCFIDKNPALQKIDQYLDDSYMKTTDYYFNFAKECFLQDKLTSMQFWGGEPFLGMHRAYYTVEKCIEYFTNLSGFMASTNFVSDIFFEEFYGFINILKKFPNRKFEFRLQLSLDGPENITDANRGKGVTKKIIEHFPKLVSELQEIVSDNITIKLFFKPTLDIKSIHQLQTKEAVLNYFQFFDSLAKQFYEINKKNNILFSPSIPNTAAPSPHTREDGVKFANYCKFTREIEEENKDKNLLKYYSKITSYPSKRKINIQEAMLSNCFMGQCGNGYSQLGLLPDRMVSCCHNGFVDLLAEYKQHIYDNNSSHMDDVVIEKGLFKNSNNKMIYAYDDISFKKYEERLTTFYKKNDTAKIANIASLIKLLAYNKQIDYKYHTSEEAIKAAYFVLNRTAYCVRDNLGVTNSIYMYPVGLLKLLLNGAEEYLRQGEDNQ